MQTEKQRLEARLLDLENDLDKQKEFLEQMVHDHDIWEVRGEIARLMTEMGEISAQLRDL